MSLSSLTDQELVAELNRRRIMPRCLCGRWQTYFGRYDRHGYTIRCAGCLRVPTECSC